MSLRKCAFCLNNDKPKIAGDNNNGEPLIGFSEKSGWTKEHLAHSLPRAHSFISYGADPAASAIQIRRGGGGLN